MDVVSICIFACWIAWIPLRLFAAARLVVRRLAGRYPALVLMLVISSAQSESLLFVALSHRCRIDLLSYSQLLDQTAPYCAALSIIATLELFWKFGTRLKNFRQYGAALALGVMAISTLVGWLASRVSVPCEGMLACSAMVVRETWLGTCAAALVMFRLWFGQFGMSRYSPNARRYMRGLALMFAGAFLCNAIGRGATTSYWLMAIAQFSLYLLPSVGLWQLLKMDEEGENVTPPLPVDLERLRATEAEVKKGFEALGG